MLVDERVQRFGQTSFLVDNVPPTHALAKASDMTLYTPSELKGRHKEALYSALKEKRQTGDELRVMGFAKD